VTSMGPSTIVDGDRAKARELGIVIDALQWGRRRSSTATRRGR